MSNEIKSPDGLMFSGDTDVLSSVVTCLFGDEYAKVETVKVESPLSLHSSWFEWGDKGRFRAWGCNTEGQVICGLKVATEYNYKTGKYSAPRIIVRMMNTASDH